MGELSCWHPNAVKVELILTGELVAWWCGDCETQLSPEFHPRPELQAWAESLERITRAWLESSETVKFATIRTAEEVEYARTRDDIRRALACVVS
jgi:hypothetical protein